MIFNHLKLLCLLALLGTTNVYAQCSIYTSSNHPALQQSDAIYQLLSSHERCADNVFIFRKQIKVSGLSIESTMVSNEGFHHPDNGSFSFFEMVSGSLKSYTIQPGDFFFGHFTAVNDLDELTAAQEPSKNSLMIEAFAWDPMKELFNFYELRGNGTTGQWFYRGDSADIYADNTHLHRQEDPANPQFGNRLRCSGCHSAGGPIMKELSAPHNDWWEPIRQLDFGGRKFDASISDIMNNLVPADRLAESVKAGMQKLEDHKSLDENHLSLQEKLRPLFCAVEVNFASDASANESKQALIHIPIDFFADSKLTRHFNGQISIRRNDYENALTLVDAHFPGTKLQDADHAWLTPVNATSDLIAIDHLIKINLIDEKFASDVLSIDKSNPVFSADRCGLLKLVPKTWSLNWRDEFNKNLSAAHSKPSLALLKHFNDPTHTPQYHQLATQKFLLQCQEKLKNSKNVQQLVLLLLQRREEIRASEISKNKRGQILEPGFRVIFPDTGVKAIPGRLSLNDECDVVF